MICGVCQTGYDRPLTHCPKCGASAAATGNSLGIVSIACLYYARLAVLLVVCWAAIVACGLLLDGDYWNALFALCIEVPIGFGHFVALGLAIQFAKSR